MLYTQVCAAHRYVRIILKANNLPVSKVRQFLHSKRSRIKFTLTKERIEKTKALAGFKNEIWSRDLAFVDELTKQNNFGRYSLVRQDLFDRKIDAKGMRTEDS